MPPHSNGMGPNFVFYLTFTLCIGGLSAIRDGLHPTPMMGFSSWNAFYEFNDETKMMGIADSIKRLGLDDYGYVYLTVDDYWNTPDRDAAGNMQTNYTRLVNSVVAG